MFNKSKRDSFLIFIRLEKIPQDALILTENMINFTVQFNTSD